MQSFILSKGEKKDKFVVVNASFITTHILSNEILKKILIK